MQGFSCSTLIYTVRFQKIANKSKQICNFDPKQQFQRENRYNYKILHG